MRQRVLVVAACFVSAFFAWGIVFYGHGFYLAAFHRDMGWSIAGLSAAVGFFWAMAGIATVPLGFAIDRFGGRRTMAAGAVVTGLCVASLGRIDSEWALWAVFFVMAFGYPVMATAGIGASLARWFDRQYGMALGIALTGASVGGVVMPILMEALDRRFGFAAATAVAGLLAVAVLAPLVLLSPQPPPADAPSTAPGARFAGLGRVLRGRLFWAVALCSAAGLGAQVGFLSHQVALVEEGLGMTTAVRVVAVTVASGAVGRLVLAWLSGRTALPVLAALCYAIQAVGLVLLSASDQPWQIYASSALAGFVVGAIVMMTPLMVRAGFDDAMFGRVYGCVNVVMYAGAGLGPFLAGLLRDATGDYRISLWSLAAIHLVGGALALTGLAGLRRPG